MAAELRSKDNLPDIFARKSPYANLAGTIDRGSPQGLIQINHVAGVVFEQDSYFAGARDVLGRSEEARELTLHAVNGHDFPSQQTISQEQYDALLDATGQKEEFARKVIIQQLANGVTFGLRRYEVDVLKAACKVGGLYDTLGMSWRRDVQRNPINAKANELGLTDRYSVIEDNGESGPREVPWAQKYPDLVSTISQRWTKLAGRLTIYSSDYRHYGEALNLSHYFNRYAYAFAGRTPSRTYSADETAETWRNVDRAWMNVRGRMQPVATRESGYYDPNGIRVFPDFRLIMQQQDAVGDILQTQAALQRHLTDQFGNTEVFQTTVEALNRVQLYSGSDIVFAGSLDFQPAGQSLPNEKDVSDEFGTKVFINPGVANRRWQEARKTACKVFRSAQDIARFEAVDMNLDGIAIRLAGHEYAEPLIQTDDVVAAFGEQTISLLNEDLANLCISAGMRRRVAEGDLTDKALINHSVNLLGTYLKQLATARGSGHLRPYYVGHALQGLRRMINSGFIEQNAAGDWIMVPERLDKLYDLTERDLVEQVRIAEEKDLPAAKAYLAKAQETPEIQDLIRRVNPDALFAN